MYLLFKHRDILFQNRELEELKKAHAKRLDRLKSAQTDYKILKDQLKLYEDENRYRTFIISQTAP